MNQEIPTSFGEKTVLLVLVFLVLFASGCLNLKRSKRQPDNDAKNCAGVSCWKPPSNTCTADDALQVYAPSGYCSGGECSYASRQEQCHLGICDEGDCVNTPCQGVFCIDPPPPSCTEANRTIFAPSGYCSGGECSYASKTSACGFSCESGSCTESPCAEVFCRKPPAHYCQDNKNLVVFEPEGRCTVVEDRPMCLHQSQTIACVHGCKDGRCQDDPCVGVICDHPPARYCDGAELVLFEPYGFCTERGFCAYIEQRKPCVEPCVDAHCGEDDACKPANCNEPPASYCHEPSVLRVYSRVGWCMDGYCSYVWSDVACLSGCEDGRCKGNPCSGKLCDRSPAARCDGELLIDFEKKGTCNDGICTYPKQETNCQNGCENAKCLPGGDTDIDTDSDTNTDTDTSGNANWVTVPAGEFWMGSPDGDCPTGYPGGTRIECPSELGRYPVSAIEELHKVTLTGSFQMMKYEVTQGEFEAAMGWNPSTIDCTRGCSATHPVYYANWYDAVAYANKLSGDEGLEGCYDIMAVSCQVDDNPGGHDDYVVCYDGSDGNKSGGIKTATVELNGVATPYECTGYRLPTEAEWERAIRAESHTAIYPSDGNDGRITVINSCSTVDPNVDQTCWYCANISGKSAPVGGKKANKWGLHDMSGNVREWVWDRYSEFTADSVIDPIGSASGSNRVVRGGHWNGFAEDCRSATRLSDPASGRYSSIGFRLTRSNP